MYATTPLGTPGIISVAGLLASIESNMGGVPTPATAAAAGLQGKQLLYDENLIQGSTPMKTEREGGLGTLGLPGGDTKGVSLVLLSTDNVRGYCLGQIGRDRVCLLQARLCDVVKHEKQKLEIREAMVHIMAPATKQTKFAAYEAPALAVANLSEKQYAELTQEKHPVNDWNIIILAIKAGHQPSVYTKEEGEIPFGGSCSGCAGG
jgi:hypothetical protein